MEVVGLGLGVEVGSEDVHDPLPMHPVPRREGEELDKTARLAQAPRATFDGSRSYRYLETTQQPDAHSLGFDAAPDGTGTAPRLSRWQTVCHPSISFPTARMRLSLSCNVPIVHPVRGAHITRIASLCSSPSVYSFSSVGWGEECPPPLHT